MLPEVRILKPILKKLHGGLIVSCQAETGEPLSHPEHITALALSAVHGGAKGLRLEGISNVRAVKQHDAPGVPIIGLVKASQVPISERLGSVYITGQFKDAEALADAGADIIALDATGRPRLDGLSLKETIDLIHNDLNKPVWADVSTLAEGTLASGLGADIIATTLWGYTKETVQQESTGPGFDLLENLVKHTSTPAVLEGRVWHPDEVRKAFDLGAYAVVVGSAITRPKLITQRFACVTPSYRKTS